MGRHKKHHQEYDDSRFSYIKKKAKSTGELLTDMGSDFIELCKKYPKIMFVVVVFHVWLYILAVHHIREFRSWWEFIKNFGM